MIRSCMKVKHSRERVREREKIFLLTDFSGSLRLPHVLAHIHDLKNTRCAFYLLCTLPHFLCVPLPKLLSTVKGGKQKLTTICMSNLILRNFMTPNGRRKKRTLIFTLCCLFLLFHFLIIASDEQGECRRRWMSFQACATLTEAFTDGNAKLLPSGENLKSTTDLFTKIASRVTAKETFFCFLPPLHASNDNKLYPLKSCRELLPLSWDLSLRFISPTSQRSQQRQFIIFHDKAFKFPPFALWMMLRSPARLEESRR